MPAINPASKPYNFVAIDIFPVTPDDFGNLKWPACAIRAQAGVTNRRVAGMSVL